MRLCAIVLAVAIVQPVYAQNPPPRAPGLPSLDHALLDKPFTPASLIAAVAALLGAAKAGLR